MGTWLALQIDTEKLRALNTKPKHFVDKLGHILFNHKSCMFVTRCRPGLDEHVFEDVPGFPMTPYMSHGGGEDCRQGGKAIYDALMPAEYTTGCHFRRVSYEWSYPKSVREKIESNWLRLGFNPT
jgi:hypothetical protein